MEKDSLKEATCELIKEARLTNTILQELLREIASKTQQSRFKNDEQAFLTYWTQVSFREQWDLHTPVVVARAAWAAALNWERVRTK